MRKILKRFLCLALAVLLLVTTLISVAPPRSAQAATDEDIPAITFVDYDGGKTFFDNTFRTTFRWLDRSHIQVSVSGSNANYSVLGSTKLKTFTEGIYEDSNLDFDFDYRITSGGSEQFSIIDRFDDSLDNDANNDSDFDNPDYLKKLDTGSGFFDKYLQNVEHTIGIDEDDLDGIDCGGTGSDEPLGLDVDGDDEDQGGVDWECSDEEGDVEQFNGMNVAESNWVDLNNFNIVFRWNGDTGADAILESVDGDSGNNFSFCETASGGRSNVFVRGSDCTAGEFINTTPDDLNANINELTIEDDDGDTVTVLIAGQEHDTDDEIDTVNDGGGDADGAEPSCESEGGEMSWLLCPALRLASSVISYLDEQIQILLSVPNKYFEGPNSAALRATWARLRNIAFIILVPMMLIMVISTAMGFSFIDAYTIKKALPRLFAAVLFMSLSYEICTFMIKLTNDIGSGMLGLISSSFGDGKITLDQLFNAGNEEGLIFSVSLLVGVGLAALAGIGILLSYAFVIGLVLLFGFLCLALRQMLLIALLVLSPLAILAWIFPGNDKLWKLWWNTFSKLLLLFPLIMLLIASGRVFAVMVQDAGDQGLLETILKLTAYVGPYLFIPATFKFAGGVFAQVTGMVNDRGRGIFDRQRKYRGETFKNRRELAGSENLFNKNSRFGRLAKFGNKAAGWTAYPGANAKYAVGKFGQKHGIGALSGVGADIRSSIAHKTLDQTAKLSQELQAAGFNDKALATVAGIHKNLSEPVKDRLKQAGLYNKRLTSRQDIETAAEIMRHSGSETEKIGANAMLGAADRIGGLYKDNDMNYASVAGAAVMEWSRQGFASSEDLAEFGNTEMQAHGKAGAQELVTRAQLMGQAARPDLKAGYGVLYDSDRKGFVSGTVADADRYETYDFTDPTTGRTEQRTRKTDYKTWAPTERGKALVDTIKQQDWMGAKSGAVQELYSNIREVANETVKDASGQTIMDDVETVVRDKAGEARRDENGEVITRIEKKPRYTAKAKAMQEQIALGASQFSSSDTGAKVVWKELASEIGVDVASFDAAQAAQMQARGAGAGGPAAGGGGDAGAGAVGGGGAA